MTDAALQPDRTLIGSFINRICSDWGFLDGDPLIEIRSIGQGGGAHVARFRLDSMDEAAEHAQSMNAAKQNIYMCINPVDGDANIQAGKGAKDADIMAAFYCFADADTDGAMQNILSFAGPKFTMSVKTGTVPFTRGHAYWQLEEPVYNLDAWRQVQKAIAARLNTDPMVINPSRIMRVAGTVSWPNKDKVAKGYIPEVVDMRTLFSADRDPVPFERLMQVFPSTKAPELTGKGSLSIDTGQENMDRALAEHSILTGEAWHTNVLRLVGSYVSKGLTDNEIHAITDRFTLDGYTIEDTREEVQRAIDGARSKGWTPEPDPAIERMERQAPPAQVDVEPAPDAQQDDFPTVYDFFDGSILPPRRWVYGNHYLRSFVSVLASAGGVGKTSMQIVEALSICTGRALLGEAVKEQTNVWLVNLEDPMEEMQRRIIAAMQFYEIKPEEVAGRLFVNAGREFQMTFAAQTRDGVIPNDALVAHLMKKIPEREIGAVFIDPFVNAHAVGENDNGAVNEVVAQIRRVADETDCAIGLVHHIRKGNGEDASIDSVRGAGSLIGAARAARVINRITEDDAMQLGVSEAESVGLFRVDDGKANLAPPAINAVYRRMVSVKIANGESVGVATHFKMPDAFDGITAKDTMKVQQVVGNAAETEALRESPQAKAWVGHVVGELLGIDTTEAEGKARIKMILRQWVKTDVLRREKHIEARSGRETPVIVVGKWINRDEAGY